MVSDDCKSSRGLILRSSFMFLYWLPRECHSESLPAPLLLPPPSSPRSFCPPFYSPFFALRRSRVSVSFAFFFFFTQSISFPTMPGTILRRRIVNHSRAFSTYSYANWGTLTCIYIYICVYISIYI